MFPSDVKFTQEHEWVKLEGDVATIGISSYAVEELGEIVFVDLPEIDAELEQMSEFGSVESVKTVSSLYLPMSGIVMAINKSAKENPEVINQSPYEDGWLIKLKISDDKEYDDLLTPEEYEHHLDSLA